MGVICCAFDNEYSIVVVLTKGTKVLCKQTVARIKSEFLSFIDKDEVEVYDILDMPRLGTYELKKNIIIIAKKQVHNIDRLLKFFESNDHIFKLRKALIVDDEADFASIGFKKDKNKDIDINRTAKQLNQLREIINNCSFLQVTATPYSLYLQPADFVVKGALFKPVRPAFTQLVPINAEYTGGDYYFSEEDENHNKSLFYPIDEHELDTLKNCDRRRVRNGQSLTASNIEGLRRAVCNLVMGVSLLKYLYKETTKYSFLIHSESATKSHKWQGTLVEEILAELEKPENEEVRAKLFKSAYEDLLKSFMLYNSNTAPSFEETQKVAIKLIEEQAVIVTVINSDSDVEKYLDDSGQLRLRTPINIFIGGQCLDRGITLANLVGFYYGRNPKKFQQDTVLQHSRMFGYRTKEQLSITRLYTTPRIYDSMKKMHEFDCALRAEIEKNPNKEIVFVQKDDKGQIIPCSPNKILITETTALKPFKRILPVGFTTVAKKIVNKESESIEAILLKNGNFQPGKPFKLELRKAHAILEHLKECFEFDEGRGYSFDWDIAQSVLRYLAGLSIEKNLIWCTVFTGRKLKRLVSERSHTEYSDAPDSTKTEGVLRKKFSNLPMLCLIKQEGRNEDGWKDTPFYWPVISAQDNIQTAIFAHDVQRDNE